MTETTKTSTGKSAKPSSAAELDPKPALPPDALALKLASDPRFVVIKRSGKGFVIGGRALRHGDSLPVRCLTQVPNDYHI